MNVLHQVLSPGVQNAKHADLGTQVPGIGPYFQQRLGAGLKGQIPLHSS